MSWTWSKADLIDHFNESGKPVPDFVTEAPDSALFASGLTCVYDEDSGKLLFGSAPLHRIGDEAPPLLPMLSIDPIADGETT